MKNVLENIHPYQTDHIAQTPKRFIKYLKEKTSGYDVDIAEYIEDAVYPITNDNCSCLDTISQNDISFSSICIHHLLPFYGSVNVTYKPKKYIIGLSKIARVCDILSKRLNIQEQYGNDIVKHLSSILEPEFLQVTVKAYHTCMSCRGVHKNAETVSVHTYTE